MYAIYVSEKHESKIAVQTESPGIPIRKES